jgi:hypothetical protein
MSNVGQFRISDIHSFGGRSCEEGQIERIFLGDGEPLVNSIRIYLAIPVCPIVGDGRTDTK